MVKDFNPTALVLIALATVVGAIFDAVLVGAAVGLGIVLLGDLLEGVRS